VVASMWKLDFHLHNVPMQSVPITIIFIRGVWFPSMARCTWYNIMW